METRRRATCDFLSASHIEGLVMVQIATQDGRVVFTADLRRQSTARSSLRALVFLWNRRERNPNPFCPSTTFPHASSVSQPRPYPTDGTDRQPGPLLLWRIHASAFPKHWISGTYRCRVVRLPSGFRSYLLR